MIDIEALTISGGFALVGLCAFAMATVIARRSRASDKTQAVASVAVCAGPIARLDFAQSLDPGLFAQAAEEEALAYAEVNLRNFIAEGTTITLHTLRQWAKAVQRSEMVTRSSM